MEYKGHVFGCPDKDKPRYVSGNPVTVNANSLDEALELIEERARIQFPESDFPLIHIDRVFGEKRLVYATAWDETGPLAAVKSE